MLSTMIVHHVFALALVTISNGNWEVKYTDVYKSREDCNAAMIVQDIKAPSRCVYLDKLMISTE